MLSGVLFCFLFVGTCLSDGGNSSVEQLLRCPGECTEEKTCLNSLNETDCENGLVCCLDRLENESTTEFVEFTTNKTPDSSSDLKLEAETEDSTERENNEDYTYVFSEESDVLEMYSPEERSGDLSKSCPGMCIQSRDIENCDYITTSEGACPQDFTCCLLESDMQKTKDQYDYTIEEMHTLSKRESNFPDSISCPGTCIHPSRAMFCEEILTQFSCPLNAKCCIKSSIDRVMSVTECTGKCMPSNMHGYCFPPNDLVIGPTTCPRGTTCCMPRTSDGRPTSVSGMHIPGLPSRDSDSSKMVLGHLAIDDFGTVFKVNTNGQISQLPQLSHMDHLRSQYTKVTVYPRVDGEIAIYMDANGQLYQQFFPRQLNRPENPLVRQPIHHFDSKPSGTFQRPPEHLDNEKDIVIPDEDEMSVSTTAQDEKTSRPQCPGSCMSYFLRFTCFRGYAIYDGFTCPGRTVCCARLKDIENHEQYLKSLSPYFNPHSTSRVPRCGIKGTSRVTDGKESLPGEWCWQVAIINVQNQYICGGALIDDSWILTAAHCVIGAMNENQALFVRVGVTDLKSTEDNNKGQTVRVLSTYLHHNFNGVNLDNNIALLRLQKPVELGSNVCVICLPTRGQMPKEDAKCTVTGYGFVGNDGDMSLVIREAEVPIIDDMDCMANVSEAMANPFILPSSSFCAGGDGQQDACQGDAGGPLACEVGGYHELVGLVSWGLGCDRNDVPSIYIKVPTFMGWINQIISSSSFLTSLS